jgi:hypothetical protein
MHHLNNVYFVSENSNFTGENFVIHENGEPTKNIVKAVAAAIGFHSGNILPTLNGFAGYDAYTYKVIATDDPHQKFLEIENEFKVRQNRLGLKPK